MHKVPAAIAVSLALTVCGLFAMAPAAAQSFRGQQFSGGHFPGMGGRHIGARPFAPRPFTPRGFSPHHFHHRPFVRGFSSFGVFASPFAFYAPPPFFYGPGGYVDPPVGYDPPAVSAPLLSRAITLAPAPPPPPAPPAPSVVEFSTGRYELRGDGLTTPYRWVWIPNPPSAPPPSSWPPTPPSVYDQPSGHRPELYRWTDEQGVLHLTDRWEAVPPQYRSRAKQPS